MRTMFLATLAFAVGLTTSAAAEVITCDKTPNLLAEYGAITDEQREALAAQPGDPTLGPEDAKGVIVEFIDYACPFCRRMASDIVELTEEHPDLQVVFKEYPLIADHASPLAAQASVVVARGTGWKAFHASLMGSSQGLSIEEAILEAADAAGIDVDRLEDGMFSQETEATIIASCRLGYELGISGTPGFIVWDLVLGSALPATMLKPLAILAMEPDNITAQKDLYDAMIQQYDPDSYRYPSGFMRILRKIDLNWRKRQAELNTYIYDLVRERDKYAARIDELTGWWMEVKAFLGLEERPELESFRLQFEMVTTELRDTELDLEQLHNWAPHKTLEEQVKSSRASAYDEIIEQMSATDGAKRERMEQINGDPEYLKILLSECADNGTDFCESLRKRYSGQEDQYRNEQTSVVTEEQREAGRDMFRALVGRRLISCEEHPDECERQRRIDALAEERLIFCRENPDKCEEAYPNGFLMPPNKDREDSENSR